MAIQFKFSIQRLTSKNGLCIRQYTVSQAGLLHVQQSDVGLRKKAFAGTTYKIILTSIYGGWVTYMNLRNLQGGPHHVLWSDRG